MSGNVDLAQFNEFAESLKSTLAIFKGQQEEIASLKQTIHELEQRTLTLSATPGYAQKADYGWKDPKAAKEFLTLIKSVFTQDYATAKDLTEGVDTEGGYVVPEEWRNNLIMMLESYGVGRREVTNIPIAREELVIPKLTSGVQTYWVGEGRTIPQTQPSFGEIRMIVKKMAAMVPITSELLSDSVIAIANLLSTLFAQAIAREEDRVIFTGDVAGAGDPFNGVLHDPDVSNSAMASGSTSFADLDADFLADVVTSVSSIVGEGARWYMHRTIFNILRKMQVQTYDGSSLANNNQYVYSAPAGSDPGTIWGYPYTLVESMPTIADDAADTPFMFFGNMKHYYLADRQALSIARSEHVGFAQDKIFIRVLQRESMAAAVPEAFTVIRTAAS